MLTSLTSMITSILWRSSIVFIATATVAALTRNPATTELVVCAVIYTLIVGVVSVVRALRARHTREA